MNNLLASVALRKKNNLLASVNLMKKKGQRDI